MTDALVTHYITTESKLSDLPIEDGQLIFIRDICTIAFDFDGKRTLFKQIVELETETARQSLLAPINGIYYFVKETKVLWTYQDNTWMTLSSSSNDITIDELQKKADCSTTIDLALSTSNWNNNTQTLTIAGLTKTQNGTIFISQSATLEEREAARNAQLAVIQQNENALVISADGDIPNIDIPVTIIFLN